MTAEKITFSILLITAISSIVGAIRDDKNDSKTLKILNISIYLWILIPCILAIFFLTLHLNMRNSNTKETTIAKNTTPLNIYKLTRLDNKNIGYIRLRGIKGKRAPRINSKYPTVENLDSNIVKEYYETKFMDSLIVFGDDQEILDTIYRCTFIQEDGPFGHETYAGYHTEHINQLATTLSNYNTIKYVKSPPVSTNFPFSDKILKDNLISFDTIFSKASFNFNDHTYNLISTSKRKDSTNLLRSGVTLIKDQTIVDRNEEHNFVIKNITPIPFTTKNYITFLVYGYFLDKDEACVFDGHRILSIDIASDKMCYNSTKCYF